MNLEEGQTYAVAIILPNSLTQRFLNPETESLLGFWLHVNCESMLFDDWFYDLDYQVDDTGV